MRKLTTILTSGVAAATFLASSAYAEMQYYGGGGIGYSKATSEDNNIRTSEGDLFELGVTLGARYDRQRLFFAAELDSDINVGGEMEYSGTPCSGGASGPYFCSQAATVRLRGMVGTSISSYEVFGTLGYAVMFGNGAISPAGNTDLGSVGGVTYGVGAQKAFGNGTLRLEVIQDSLTSIIDKPAGQGEPTWEATTVKVSYLWDF